MTTAAATIPPAAMAQQPGVDGGDGRGGEATCSSVSGRRGQRRRADGEVEQLDVRVAQEQHRRRPLDRIDLAVHGLAGFGDGGVDRRLAADEVHVQLGAEDDRGGVADLELHGDDGWHAEADERGGDPGVGIADRRAGALARVEDDEPQPVLVRQQVGEQRLVDRLGLAVVVLEEHDPVAGVGEGAVADEVEDVVAAVAKCLSQPPWRRRLQPVELDAAELAHRRHGLLDTGALLGDVERRLVGRAGDDPEDAHRRVDDDRLGLDAGGQQPHDRCLALAGQEAWPLVQELPGHAQ